MTVTVEVHVKKPLDGDPFYVRVCAEGVGRIGVQVMLIDLADVLLALTDGLIDEHPHSLRAVDAPLRASLDMDESSLRLVIELTRDDSGNTNVTLRRMDRSVDYGPLSVHDLPHVIEALVPDTPAAASAEVL